MVLVMKFHFPLSPVEDFLLSLLQIPLTQFGLSDKPIIGVHIDLGEQQHQPAGDVELLLVVQVILSIHEVFPLRLRLVGRSGVVVGHQLRVGMLKILLLPLLVFAAALNVGDERVEGYGVVVGMVVGRREGEGEVGPELEAPMAMARGIFGGVGNKQKHQQRHGYVYDYGGFSHFSSRFQDLENKIKKK